MTESVLTAIARIQECFDTWRESGHRQLSNGSEFLVRMEGVEDPGEDPCSSGGAYLHLLHAPASQDWLIELENWLDLELPKELRLLYRKFGGASFFDGRIRIAGPCQPFIRVGVEAHQPPDIYELNTPTTLYRESPEDAIAFAIRATDQARFLLPYPSISTEVVAQLPNSDFTASWPSLWDWLQAVVEERDTEAALIERKTHPDVAHAKELIEAAYVLPTPTEDELLLPRPMELLGRLRSGESSEAIWNQLRTREEILRDVMKGETVESADC
jgi:hypothetical protein